MLIISISTAAWLFLRYQDYKYKSDHDHFRTLMNCGFPSATEIRTNVIRFIVAKDKDGIKVDFSKFRFNKPEDLKNLAEGSVGIFDPETVNVSYETYMNAPADCMEGSLGGKIIFSRELTTNILPDHETVVSFFVIGINESKCLNANRNIGIMDNTWSFIPVKPPFTHPIIPKLNSDQSSLYKTEFIDKKEAPYVFKDGERPQLDNKILLEKGAGCFQSFDGKEFVMFGGVI